MGALSDSLLPFNKVSPQKDNTLKGKAVASVGTSGAGKYIQVSLHGVIYVIVLGICPIHDLVTFRAVFLLNMQ